MAQSREPQKVSDYIWYYEEGRKFDFVVQTAHFEKRDGPNQTIQFSVPLLLLERSLARSPKKGKSR
jgi:hypothetical protein